MADRGSAVPDDDARTHEHADEPVRKSVREPAGPRHRFRDLVRSPEVVASVIVGFLTVLAAIAGAAATNLIEVRQTVTAPSSGELTGDVEKLQKRLTASQAEVEMLKDQVGALEEENARLGGTASSDSGGDAAPAAGGDAAIFRESAEPFTIARGSCIDLDSQEANWDREADSRLWLYDPEDLCFVEEGLQLREIVVIEDGADTLEACEAQTLLQGDTIGPRYVREGLRICGRTNDGRPASVGVAEATDTSVTLDVRVWE